MVELRRLIIDNGGLKRALPLLARGTVFKDIGGKLTPQSLTVLNIVAAAMSELQSAKGRAGDKTKLPPSMREAILKAIADGKSIAEISRDTGSSRTTIYRVIDRQPKKFKAV